MRALALLSIFLVSPALAQVVPLAGVGDPHLQIVDYDASQIVRLHGTPGYQLMVELSPDEQVQSVAVGDSAAWQVSLSKSGDRLFIKAVQAQVPTNMSVVTSVRVYNFELIPLPEPTRDMPYTVQFHYPTPRAREPDDEYVDVAAFSRRLSKYRISGDRSLRPIAVSDDGQRTYISWAKGGPIPAVYALDRMGKDALINGMMGTDDVYVVDGAPQRLKFRIDRNVAYAERINPRKGR